MKVKESILEPLFIICQFMEILEDGEIILINSHKFWCGSWVWYLIIMGSKWMLNFVKRF